MERPDAGGEVVVLVGAGIGPRRIVESCWADHGGVGPLIWRVIRRSCLSPKYLTQYRLRKGRTNDSVQSVLVTAAE